MSYRHHGRPERIGGPMRTRDSGDVASMSVGQMMATARDTASALPQERHFDSGNRRYVLSLPPGEYDAEDDEAAGLTRVSVAGSAENGGARVAHDDPAAFIVALPLGRYSIDRDERGFAHLYREPEGAKPRTPLTSDARYPASIMRLFRVT